MKIKADVSKIKWASSPQPSAKPTMEPAPAASKEPAAEPEWFSPESKSGTILRKFGSGAGFNLIDEGRGLAGAAEEAALRLNPLTDENLQKYEHLPFLEALKKRYVEDRDSARREEQASEKSHPILAKASEVAGSLTTPLKAAKGGSLALRAGSMVAQGAGQAALSSLGKSEGDMEEGITDALKAAAIGGLAGGVLGGVAGKAGDVGRKLESGWRSEAVGKAMDRGNLREALKAMKGPLPDAGVPGYLAKEGGKVVASAAAAKMGGPMGYFASHAFGLRPRLPNKLQGAVMGQGVEKAAQAGGVMLPEDLEADMVKKKNPNAEIFKARFGGRK